MSGGQEQQRRAGEAGRATEDLAVPLSKMGWILSSRVTGSDLHF